jgi:putative toxin-antitoxin system antitoxin component (TIGR02293 family)
MTDLSLQSRQWEIVGTLLGVSEQPLSDLDAVRLVRKRFQPEVIARLGRAGISTDVLHRVIPRRTLEHRRQRQESLTQEESERAYRVANILALAETVMGDRTRALSWLTAPKRSLDGETPMDLLDTEPGARAVEELLYAIDEGYFA